MHNRPTRRGAFTLVELMVVVLIIGILASIVTISVTDYLSMGKQSAAKANIAELANALELFYMEFDRYPTSEEGLAELKKPSQSHPNGILRSGSLLDAWGHAYVYVYPGVHGAYDIISYGANGVEGGTGADADICSWDLSKQNQTASK
jgi:general secretion pathway protein G